MDDDDIYGSILSDPSRSSTSTNKTSKPTNQDAPQSSLFVSNLAWWTNENDLRVAFEEFAAKAKNIQFLEHKSNGKSKGIAIVEFVDEVVASKAKEIADGKEINGMNCSITFARSPPIKPYERPRPHSKPIPISEERRDDRRDIDYERDRERDRERRDSFESRDRARRDDRDYRRNRSRSPASHRSRRY